MSIAPPRAPAKKVDSLANEEAPLSDEEWDEHVHEHHRQARAAWAQEMERRAERYSRHPLPSLPFYPALVPGQPMPAPSPEQRALDRVFYPESDGLLIAESTEQFRWIEMLKGGFDALFASDPNVFVAADLLWCPLETRRDINTAPDVLIVLGRPKGARGTYEQWREEGGPPHVVWEILSPSNTAPEMARKLAFCDRHGVSEYYYYDPLGQTFRVWLRILAGGPLEEVKDPWAWESVLLGVRFERDDAGDLRVVRRDGRAFVSYVELDRQRAEAERQRQLAEDDRSFAEAARREADQQREQAEAERNAQRARADALAARLRELGVDPDAPAGGAGPGA